MFERIATDSQMEMTSAVSTYHGFVRGIVACSLFTIQILLVLIDAGFAKSWGGGLVALGLIVGTIVILMDWRSGTERWSASIGWLVVFGIMTTLAVS